ncbi:membrane protein [Paraburkholderia phenoliruptrix]|uniref:membrane protein n=1 Tax=Paraburkholderia phenoliruptrix TaxID=252970 RepID=UPI0001C01F3B
MDHHNLFETPVTYRLIRLEYLAALTICVGLLVAHWTQIRWWAFAFLFLYIDLIGYLPGAVAHRRHYGRRIARRFYVLYNVAHSALSGFFVAAAWAWFVEPEWALLAIPIHLCGDRAIFGNFLKPFGLSFEPALHPDFAAFKTSYAQSVAPERGGADAA